MATGSLLFGFLFLINGEFLSLDPIPDAIGYLLIAHGLYRMSFLEERIHTARRWALLLAAVSAVRLLSAPMTLLASFESDRLTIMFVFFLVETVLSLLLVDNAFKGFQYLAVRMDSDVSLRGYEVAKTFTMAFFIAKNVFYLLPQLSVLLFYQVDSDPELVENYASLRGQYNVTRGVLLIIGFLVMLILGIYTFRILKEYRANARSDRAFCDRLKERFEEKVTSSPSMQTRLAVRSAFAFFWIAFLFLPDMYVDGVGILPTFLFPLFCYFGISRLRKVLKLPRLAVLIPLVSVFPCLAAYVYRTVAFFTDRDFYTSFRADGLSFALGLSVPICLVAAAVPMLFCIRLAAKNYTSQSYRILPVLILIAVAVAGGLGFSQYRFFGFANSVPFLQLVVTLAALYFHKKSIDEIRAELEWKLL